LGRVREDYVPRHAADSEPGAYPVSHPCLDLRSGPPVPDVRRIAVLRAGGLGDLVAVLPALDALRAAYPDAEILLLCAPIHAELMTDRPGPVDRVLVVPCTRGIREPAPWEAVDEAEIAAFLAGLPPIDLALQLHGGGGYSNPFVRRLGARVTAGLRAPEAPPLDRTAPYVYLQAEAVRFLEVAALVGAPPVRLEPRLAVTEADRVAAAEALGPVTGPVVVLHPGAGDPRRRWPAGRFATLGRRLADDGATVVVVGSPHERDLVAEVAAGIRAPVRALAGEQGLSGLVGVLERAAVVVADDSGPRHLAAAVGTPTVGIFWGPNVVNAGPLTRSRHRAHVSWTAACPRCGAPLLGGGEGCTHAESLVADVPLEDVEADARELLAYHADG
jgi:ADP-heptose:LPS heptosyltransferase